MNANLFVAFEPSFRTAAKRPALRQVDGRVITYGELERESARLANVLSAEGVTPGDRVAVQVEKSVENVFLYLACLKVGAVYLPLNTAYTDSELDYFFSDAEPKVIVCKPERADDIRRLASTANATLHTLNTEGGGSLIQAASSKGDASQPTRRAAGDLAAILAPPGAPKGR